jgi:hypothetical protein
VGRSCAFTSKSSRSFVGVTQRAAGFVAVCVKPIGVGVPAPNDGMHPGVCCGGTIICLAYVNGCEVTSGIAAAFCVMLTISGR